MAKQVNLTRGIARILDDSVLEEYNESIKGYNERARGSLGKFDRSDGKLIGSNPLMIIHLVNSKLLPEGTKLATREDLGNAISKDGSFLRGKYADFALALRTAGDFYEPNNLLAKRLAEQLKRRDISLDRGKLIPLDALSLTEDENSAYGLVINLKDRAKSSIRDLNDFKWDRTRDKGLACALLYMDRYWDSNFEHLAYSSGLGRVVVVSAKGATKNSGKEDLMKKVKSALNARNAFEYQGTIYVPVSDKSIKTNK